MPRNIRVERSSRDVAWPTDTVQSLLRISKPNKGLGAFARWGDTTLCLIPDGEHQLAATIDVRLAVRDFGIGWLNSAEERSWPLNF